MTDEQPHETPLYTGTHDEARARLMRGEPVRLLLAGTEEKPLYWLTVQKNPEEREIPRFSAKTGHADLAHFVHKTDGRSKTPAYRLLFNYGEEAMQTIKQLLHARQYQVATPEMVFSSPYQGHRFSITTTERSRDNDMLDDFAAAVKEASLRMQASLRPHAQPRINGSGHDTPGNERKR